MGKIVAISGGEMAEGETLPFDRRIIELTGKSRPRALFIPTASADASEYQDIVQRVYGGDLGCEVEMLLLLADRLLVLSACYPTQTETVWDRLRTII